VRNPKIEKMPEKEKTKKTNWKTTDNRFVAFFDILGFKDQVMRKSHNEIYEQLSKISKTRNFIANATNHEKIYEKYNDAEIYIVNFSDSIVVFSKNDNIGNFKYFLVAIRWLFARTIEDNIPIKGGFAYGEVSLNKSEQIYFGQPIIDAYLIEEDVNYFGLVAHNSIDNYITTNKVELSEEFFKHMFFEAQTPLKCGKIIHQNVNWFTKVPSRQKDFSEFQSEIYILEILNRFKQTMSGSPRRYLDNTLEVLDKINIIEYLKNE